MPPDDLMPLARIVPLRMPAQTTGLAAEPQVMTARQKAAVIVRLMLAEGTALPLSALPEHLQAAIAEQMGRMRMVDRTTLAQIVGEFMQELEQVGLSFPGGIEGALTIMDGHISTTAANRLRRLSGNGSSADPWERLIALPVERLLPVLESESVEVAAVMLSKLPVPRAAELLGRLPGDRARRVAYAVSMTGNVDPAAVRRIGASLISQLDNQPVSAFETGPVERVGAILNISPVVTREDVLKGLDEADASFADQVRRALFTFVHIPKRLAARDVPKVIRVVDQPVLITALAYAAVQPDLAASTAHILDNLSQRMTQGLREEIAARGRVKDRDGEDAMATVIGAIRQLQGAGEIVLISEDDA